MSSCSSSLVPPFLIVCARPRYLVMLGWLSLVLVGCRLCSFGFHSCPFGFCSCSFGFVRARSVVVCARLCHPAIHPYPLVWLSFVLVHGFRACAFLLRACLCLLRARLGLFGFIRAHLSVSNTHLVHRFIIKKLTF